jgi:sugar-specific transcriptional regulator TrmB
MVAQEDGVEALTTIGLTHCQAKIYLALLTLGKANTKKIQSHSGVPRQDIYRVLNELQNIGLVEKIISAPTEFKAIEIQEGLSILLKRKVDEYDIIKKKTDELLNKFATKREDASEEGQLVWTEQGNSSEHRLDKILENTQKSIELVCPWFLFRGAIVRYAEFYLNGADRGMKFRFIIEKPEDKRTMPKVVQTLKKKGALEMKYARFRLQNSFLLSDEKELFYSATPNFNGRKAPFVWTNNPCLVATIKEYFELKWKDSSAE